MSILKDREVLPLPKEAPERIYGWLDTQMSLARYCGGLTYMGHSYYVSPKEEGKPLVRADVMRRDAKEKADRRKAERKASKEFAMRVQRVLL